MADINLSVKIEGLDRLQGVSQKIIDNVNREVRVGLAGSAALIETTAKESILNGQKTGRVYQRGSVSHQASAPGEAPASDTGRLVNSIHVSKVSGDDLAIDIKAGGGVVKYARMLEFGTVKMAARPFFFPSVERNRQAVIARLQRAFEKGVKGAAKP